jgi:plastocyanin
MRAALAIVLALWGASPAAAGTIHGSVKVSPPPAQDATYRPYAGRASSLPAPARSPRGLVTDAVIYVEALPAGAGPPSHGPTPQLAQRDQSFEPRVVVVAAGGTVGFPNFDPVYHNVFSVSPVRRFDLGKYPRGQSRSVMFPKPGLVNVFCDIHADMARSSWWSRMRRGHAPRQPVRAERAARGPRLPGGTDFPPGWPT